MVDFKSMRNAFVFVCVACSFTSALAESHPTGIPELNSRAGAAYTLYLDFGGFNYNGSWGGDTPGNTQAYLGVTTSYTSAQQLAMKKIWARIAESYSAFNVNVTTVDPAVAAGKSSTDALRQSYYDSTAKMMHTVVSGTGSWLPGAGGVSYVGVTQYTYSNTGYHTNFVFADQAPSNYAFIGQAVAHEDGHGLGLWHQGDKGSAEYSSNHDAQGNGSYAPIMGVAYYSQRGLWRIGYSSSLSTPQNDVQTILQNSGIGGYIDDGISHSMSTATLLAVTGSSVDYSQAKGIITPVSTTSPTALGAASYTSDYFRFNSLGGLVSLTVHDGGQYITAGEAAEGAMLQAMLSVFNSAGTLIGTSILSTDTLSSTFSSNLAAGTYFLQVSSTGGFTSTYDSSQYYNFGSYFLTGTGVAAVPEPATLIGLGLGLVALARRRRK